MMVRMTSEVETNIVAVERVKEYAETPTEVLHRAYGYSDPSLLRTPLYPSKSVI